MRSVVIVAAANVCALLLSTVAIAGDGQKPPVVSATVTDSTEVVDDPPPPAPIPCTWFYPPSSETEADVYNVVVEIVNDILTIVFFESRTVTVTYYYDEGVLNRWNDITGQFEWRQQADCSAATDPGTISTGDVRYVPTAPPDPSILLRRTTVIVTEEIDVPTPTLNPPDRTAIMLGMWLSVDDVGPVVARADLGPLWAETTAALASTTFDPGNGDAPITCSGFGTPIPDSALDSVDEGPCGYTFAELPAGGDTTFTITATWAVTWRLSDGRTGREADIVVSTDVPYEVYEIQTVGTG